MGWLVSGLLLSGQWGGLLIGNFFLVRQSVGWLVTLVSLVGWLVGYFCPVGWLIGYFSPFPRLVGWFL